MDKHVLDIAARDITQLIHSTINRPYEVAVAGGAVRDMARGFKPKDLDIVVAVGPDSCTAEVFSWMMTMSVTLSQLDIASEVFLAYTDEEANCDSDFDEKLYGGIKIKHPVIEIDVLFSRKPSMSEAVEDFDCILNKLWTADMRYVQGHVYVVDTSVQGMPYVASHARTERLDKMMALAIKYDGVPIVHNLDDLEEELRE
ncbi:putative nucleotidyl transferase [Vibrio phage vB_VpP_FE11]|uniref:Putative nucleotidyl transferase n=1 Tax=Vibrio phage vB_VpP_FE11 TaxID=2723990 RepID=A0A6H0X3U1_9CAUD|nr:putative nucleotidyl transferase [Vibrio phage vB_VpP_FE11]